MYLSPYVEEPLYSKVMKSFVPELRSRKCFSCFEIPMFHVIYMYISHRYAMSISHMAFIMAMVHIYFRESPLTYNKCNAYLWNRRIQLKFWMRLFVFHLVLMLLKRI